MSKRKYRQTSPETKAKAVLDALQEKDEIAVVAARHNVCPKGLREWKKKFIEDSATIFENKAEEALKDEIKQLKRQQDELHKRIGQATIFEEWFKKKYRETGLRWENEPPGF